MSKLSKAGKGRFFIEIFQSACDLVIMEQK